MFSKRFAVFLFICLFSHSFGWIPIACGFQTGVPNSGLRNNSDGFAASTPPNGGNTIASNTTANNPNFYEQAAQVAQAPVPYYPTPNYNPNANYAPKPAVAGTKGGMQVMPNTMQNVASSSMSGNNMASGNNMPSSNNVTNTIVIPAVPLRPNMAPNPNAMASYNGFGANGNQNYGVTPNPASQSLSPWTSFASGTGSLFSSSLFSNNSNTNYVASNTPVSQPYLWGNSNQSGMSTQPNTSPYAMPPQSWVMPPATSYRDPMQGGMPATVVR